MTIYEKKWTPGGIYDITFPALPDNCTFGFRKQDAIKAVSSRLEGISLNFDNLPSRKEAKEILEATVLRVDEVLVCHEMTYFQVKAGKGKTEKSKKITVKVWHGGKMERDSHQENSSFYAPASMVEYRNDGTAWIPSYFLSQKLSSLGSNSPYFWAKYT